MARKILLADDSVTAQNMGRKILADAGYEVITVNNGSAALKKIAEQKPDLIVLDVYMPGYSGLEVCQRLKDVPETSRIPVILTVGKLEPFKPEEAKRVRAEGFIVKPFEASELLSALSKLEDKIVPRSEASKPGRFARAIAAVEQSNRDRNTPVEEDSGWKNRISFPAKKKKKDEAEESEQPEVYNAVNRDLRTVVPPEPANQERAADASKAPERTVDVAAVVPADLPKDSLPKDVTPEEIAAIMAAAAQVQGVTAASREISPAAAEAKSPAESAGAEPTSAPVEARSESKAEEVPPATFAEQKSEKSPEKDTPAIPGQAEGVAAIPALESGNGQAWETTAAGNGAGHSAVESAELPVTMAASAAPVWRSTGPRWTAVQVSADAAESGISLEQEMQRAQATPAAGEPDRVEAPVAAVAAPEASLASAAEPAALAEPVVRGATHEETALAQALSASAAANIAAEVVPTPVTEVTVAQAESISPAPAIELPSPAQVADVQAADFQATDVQAANIQTADIQAADIQAEAPPPAIGEEAHAEPAPYQAEYPANVEGSAPFPPKDEASGMSTQESQPAEPVAAVHEAPQQNEPAAGGIGEMGEKRDSELAASTAAAWASWRQIRSDEPRTSEPAKTQRQDDEDDDAPATSEPAAMAAAAGAEKSPEEANSGTDSRAIASIVDSVMAELRPKIVEEISRKLGEKK